MSKIFNSIDELIGNTPLLRLNNIEKEMQLSGKLFAKLEMFNPAGSAKDRVGLNMINDAQNKGLINKDTVIIEPTSGNTGIGLCAVCAARGLKVIIVMPDTMSLERRLLMKAYGAELVLTDGKLGMSGAVSKAEDLHKEIKNSIIAGQFTNNANPKAHFNTTGPEIYNALDGKVDVFVAGVGTGGTITGVGEYLKSKNKDLKVVAIEPKGSALLSGEQAGPHGLQGLGANFIPQILNTGIYDEIIKVSDEDAYKFGKLMAQKEGILVGVSSGAALYGAVLLAEKKEYKDKNIVVLLPDTGERYLSTPMFGE